MRQAQTICPERKRRRKERRPERFYIGHAVKSCMTVIESDGALSEYLEGKYLEK